MQEESVVQIVVAFITALFTGLFAKGGIDRFKSWREGREKQKRQHIDQIAELEHEIDRLERSLDNEAALRRRYAEHASDLRRMLMEQRGIAASDLPDWPTT